MYSPSPPAPTAAAIVAVPTPITVATRMPATIDGSASGSSTRRNSWPGVMPSASAGFDQRRVDRAHAGDGRADDRQQRVEHQHGDRDPRPESADERQRQQEPEHRQARDGLGDVRQPHDRGAEPRPLGGEQPDRHADQDGGQRRDADQEHVLAEQRGQLRGVRPPELDQPHGAPPWSAAVASNNGASSPLTLGSSDRAIARGVSSAASAPSARTPTAAAHRERLPHVVGHDQDGLAHLFLDPPELLVHLAPGHRIERAERLVHQQDRRIRGQRARHADSLPLAARQLVRAAGREIAIRPGRSAPAAPAPARSTFASSHPRRRGTTAMFSAMLMCGKSAISWRT